MITLTAQPPAAPQVEMIPLPAAARGSKLNAGAMLQLLV